MAFADEIDTLVRPAISAPAGTFELCHPRGLRALAAVARVVGAGSVEVRAEVSVLHLLEARDEVEREILSAARAPLLSIALLGPLSFSGDELARLHAGATPVQLDDAVKLLLDWSRRRPDRVAARFASSFVGVTPWTTLLDLRRHLDGLHRHELALDPITRVALDAGLFERARRDGLVSEAPDGSSKFRCADDDVETIVAAVAREATAPIARQDALRRALDRNAGVPRGEKKKHLRLLPAPRHEERRPARTGQVDLTRECDLACGFCSARGVEARSPRQRAAEAIAAVRRVAREGASELVISGAEPAREWYIDELVALARSLGFRRIVLETNATAFAEPGRAAEIAKAGLSIARVAINSFDAARSDAITGVAGALARSLAGSRALLDAGVGLEIAVALLPENRGELARIVAQAGAHLPATRGRVERIVARHVVSGSGGPLAFRALAGSEAAAELLEACRVAKDSDLILVAAPGTAPPPCLFAEIEPVAGVLQLDEQLAEKASRSARPKLCDGCGARHVCPGPLPAIASEVDALGKRVPLNAPGVPLTRERGRVLRELRSVLFQRGPDGSPQEHRVLRINFHCNQACDFCFVSRDLPAPEDALVEAELVEVARRGATLAISGGEPTLNPDLPRWLRRAAELGIDHVQLQTNAIKMSDPAYTAELVAAGLKSAFVSLHGTTAATSDRVTAAPGTFVRTLAGIKNLIAMGVDVCLNFVLCAYNAAELADLPGFVASELRPLGRGRVDANFSFVAAGSDNVPRDTGLIPRFSDVAWALAAAVERARALDVPLLGFDSQCGVPACFLPEEVRAVWFATDLPAEELAEVGGAFRKGDACADCAMNRRCYGLRAAYADTYGTSELVPLAP